MTCCHAAFNIRSLRYGMLTLAWLTAGFAVILWFAVVGAASHASPSIKRSEPSAILKKPIEAEHTTESPWQIACVYCPRDVDITDRSLRVDGAGRPHIAYGGDGLYYTWFNGSDWISETIDETEDSGGSAALALDSFGQPHISYGAAISGQAELRYAFLDSGVWHTATIDTYPEFIGLTSIALDAANLPHISYRSYLTDTSQLRYAHLDTAGWHTMTVDQRHGGFGQSSIGLDPLGNPHIGYGNGPDVSHAYLDESGWHTQTVDRSDEEYDLSLAVDQDGRPHLAYSSYASQALFYASQNGSTWLTQTVFSQRYSPGVSLALHEDGYPYITTGYAPELVYLDATGWHTETIEREERYPNTFSTSAAFDSHGILHVAYSTHLGWGRYVLRYAAQSNRGWGSQSIDRSGSALGATFIALDPGGYPHISGSDTYCWRGFCKPALAVYLHADQTGWHTEFIDIGEDYDFGEGPRLELDQTGRPHLLFRTNTDLTLAVRETSGWITETVHQQCNQYSLKLDSLGQAHILCLDYSTSRTLIYLAQTGPAAWITQTIVEGTNLYLPNQPLAIDGADQPHIIYRFPSGLTYAILSDTVWISETVDSGGDSAALTLDGENNPHITYTSNGVKYAHLSEAGWQSQLVDSTIGHIYGIAIDSQGQPHISYFNGDGGKYIYLSSIGWQSIDVGGKVGFFGFVLDQFDRPHSSITRDWEIIYTHLPVTYTPQVYFPLFQTSPEITTTQLR